MTQLRFNTPCILAGVSLLIATLTIPSSAIAADPPVTDANIAAIVVAANQIDIDYGKIALTKSKDKEVRGFAQRMITDHGALQKAVKSLAAKLKLTPEENPTSEGLKKNAVEITAKLNSLNGKEFDKFYIDNEVNYHTQVIGAVKTVLIPNATNPELKSALVNAEALFEKHLEHARQIQAKENQADRSK